MEEAEPAATGKYRLEAFGASLLSLEALKHRKPAHAVSGGNAQGIWSRRILHPEYPICHTPDLRRLFRTTFGKKAHLHQLEIQQPADSLKLLCTERYRYWLPAS